MTMEWQHFTNNKAPKLPDFDSFYSAGNISKVWLIKINNKLFPVIFVKTIYEIANVNQPF